MSVILGRYDWGAGPDPAGVPSPGGCGGAPATGRARPSVVGLGPSVGVRGPAPPRVPAALARLGGQPHRRVGAAGRARLAGALPDRLGVLRRPGRLAALGPAAALHAAGRRPGRPLGPADAARRRSVVLPPEQGSGRTASACTSAASGAQPRRPGRAGAEPRPRPAPPACQDEPAGTSRRSSSALPTTVMLEADMASAPNSGRSIRPRLGYSTPAATGIATTL